MNSVLSFSALCILLVVGKILRVEIRLFQKLYLPASVIGGLLGLVLVQTIGGFLPAATTADWTRLPGFLINIVFSALFLGVFIPPIRRIWRIAGPQLAYGQIVAWGQYVIGLGAAIWLLTPIFGVPGAIGTIIPVGFEGGHGTAAGLEPVFAAYSWPEGTDLALTSATCGVLFAIIVGMALVNWAARRGYTRQLKRIEDLPESSLVGVYEPAERPSAGSQTVSASSIDSLGFHLAIIGLGVFIGYLIHSGLVVDPEGDTDATSAFGYKQLMHEPFMGGGLWTSAAIPLALAYNPVVVLGISAGAVALWLLVWALLFRGRLGHG